MCIIISAYVACQCEAASRNILKELTIIATNQSSFSSEKLILSETIVYNITDQSYMFLTEAMLFSFFEPNFLPSSVVNFPGNEH